MSERMLEKSIGRMCFVGFEGLVPPHYLLDWIRAGRVGGVILFARNIASPSQVADLTDALQAVAPEGILVSIDQEGGVVARLREKQGFTEVPGAMALASATDSLHHVEQVATVMAQELRAIGVHWDYHPVVDLSYNMANPSVGTRSFGRDPQLVSLLAAAAVRGLQQGGKGVAAAAKHFPGLGNTPIDTHEGLPIVDTSLDHLENVDLVPYRAVIAENIATIMVTHTIFEALDARLPATLSPVVVNRLLRDRLRFDGVVVTDCMEMKAVSNRYGAAESAVLSAIAGFDAILFSHTPSHQEAVYDELLRSAYSGRLPRTVVDAASQRMELLRSNYLKPRSDINIIRSPQHLAIARAAAQAGVTLLKKGNELPLIDEGLAVIEFSSILESGIVESGGLTGFARLFRERFPNADVLIWREVVADSVLALARRSRILVLATRNAHLNPNQLAVAKQLMACAPQTILVVLRNPYDASELSDANTIFCTCGDAAPSLKAIIAMLAGDAVPLGKLPDGIFS